jgi:hypothetical protein
MEAATAQPNVRWNQSNVVKDTHLFLAIGVGYVVALASSILGALVTLAGCIWFSAGLLGRAHDQDALKRAMPIERFASAHSLTALTGLTALFLLLMLSERTVPLGLGVMSVFVYLSFARDVFYGRSYLYERATEPIRFWAGVLFRVALWVTLLTVGVLSHPVVWGVCDALCEAVRRGST